MTRKRGNKNTPPTSNGSKIAQSSDFVTGAPEIRASKSDKSSNNNGTALAIALSPDASSNKALLSTLIEALEVSFSHQDFFRPSIHLLLSFRNSCGGKNDHSLSLSI
jgi:hypothetical protein